MEAKTHILAQEGRQTRNSYSTYVHQTSVVEDSSSSFLLLMAEIFRGGGLCSGGRSAPSYNLSQYWLHYVLLILTAYGLSKINI